MKYRLRPLTKEDMPLLIEWRMREDITRFMNTDPVLTLQGQYAWLQQLEQDDTQMNWMIEVDGKPAGVANVSNISWRNETCSKGMYIAVKELRTMDLVASLFSSQYDFIFYTLGMNKVENEVFAENVSVVELNKRLGCVQEGYFRQHIKKHGQYYDVVRFGLLSSEWEQIRCSFNHEAVEIVSDGFAAMGRINH